MATPKEKPRKTDEHWRRGNIMEPIALRDRFNTWLHSGNEGRRQGNTQVDDNQCGAKLLWMLAPESIRTDLISLASLEDGKGVDTTYCARLKEMLEVVGGAQSLEVLQTALGQVVTAGVLAAQGTQAGRRTTRKTRG